MLACHKRWWCPSTPSLIPSSLPPSPSGTLLPLPGTRADCSISVALLIRWWAAICHHSRNCTPQGPWDALSTPPIPETNFLRLSSLQSIRVKASGHENSFSPSANSHINKYPSSVWNTSPWFEISIAPKGSKIWKSKFDSSGPHTRLLYFKQKCYVCFSF